jgi:hemolysin III
LSVPVVEPEDRPRLRGRLHLTAAIISVAGLVWLVRAAPTTPAKTAAWIYGLSALLLYSVSSTYHVFTRSPTAVKIMRRIDHSMIYILIAGTITPICVLAMDGWTRWLLLTAVWVGALFGATLTAIHGHRYPRLGFALYLVLGWAAIGTFPAFVDQPMRLVLVASAGLLYTAGAILFALKRPWPNGRLFGYHEVWHLCGVIAGSLLFVVNFGLISR